MRSLALERLVRFGYTECMKVCRSLLIAMFLPALASAEPLDLQSWLDRPGVRAVAVEFFSPYCKPCMDAMDRWKALQDRYGKDGLRLIFINVDEEGGCPTLAVKPDQLVCDLDGANVLNQSELESRPAMEWNPSHGGTDEQEGVQAADG